MYLFGIYEICLLQSFLNFYPRVKYLRFYKHLRYFNDTVYINSFLTLSIENFHLIYEI